MCVTNVCITYEKHFEFIVIMPGSGTETKQKKKPIKEPKETFISIYTLSTGIKQIFLNY
jgi:hypothetical protein